MSRSSPRRRGINLLEVAIVVAILGAAALFVLMRLPRSREKARDVACKKNLMQIGVALAQYHNDFGQLPTAYPGGPGPLRACLIHLAIPDFDGLADPEKRKPSVAGFVTSEKPVPGFVCPTDTLAFDHGYPAPVSYRASTGATADGQGGAFALGRVVKYPEVDAKDGLSYTAAFCERLIGADGASRAIRTVPGRLGEPPCPPDAPGASKSDAGASWWTASWASTLYNHALTPNAPISCRSENGATGLVGASSMHVGGVNLLTLDGSVKSYGVRVDPKIWRSLGTVDDGSASTNTTSTNP